MPYATEQDLDKRFGAYEVDQLADDGTGTDTRDAEKITTALQDASDEIDSYLGQRYQLPLTNPPSLLVAVCSDIARYKLYAASPTEEVTERNRQRMQWLRDISNKKASLGEQDASRTSGIVSATTKTGGRLFTSDTLRNF